MTIEEVQKISYEMMCDIHEFCVKNRIRYSLSGGTLLGAIRHNGFIPWDDDVDIQMPRPDYNIFVRTYKSVKGYKVFSSEVDGCNSTRLRLAKVCDMKQTYIDYGYLSWTKEKVGINIDIEPCDGAPSDYTEAKKYMRRFLMLNRLRSCYSAKFYSWRQMFRCASFKTMVYFLTKKIISIFATQAWWNLFMKYQSKYDYEKSHYFIASPHYGMREWQPKKNMDSYILHQFENSMFYIMSGWDSNLKSLYGEYMRMPPENQRVSHNYRHYYWR